MARPQNAAAHENADIVRQAATLFWGVVANHAFRDGNTIRTLAMERASELSEERQRARARRWQTERMRALADRIEAGEIAQVSQKEIDAIFDDAEAEDPKAPRRAS